MIYASTSYDEINFLLRHINESLWRYLSLIHVPTIYEKIQFLAIDFCSNVCTMKTQQFSCWSTYVPVQRVCLIGCRGHGDLRWLVLESRLHGHQRPQQVFQEQRTGSEPDVGWQIQDGVGGSQDDCQ